ncbi:MAG: DUF2490 domain-containing protein [Chitinophagales bacterium]
MHKIRFIWLAIFTVLIFHDVARAQTSRPPQTVQQFNNWFVPAVSFRFHQYVGITVEGQLRFNQFVHNQQHQARGWLDLFVNDHFVISPVGYVYTWNYRYGKMPVAVPENEHRLFEQLVWKFSEGRFYFNNRVRLEQRWVEHKSSNSLDAFARNGFVYSNRLRYRFQVSVPLNHRDLRSKTIYLSAYDECFISFGKAVTYKFPDQNRAYLGLGYKFSASGSVGLGYMHQLILRSNATKAESNHTIVVSFNYDFDLRKKKRKG